MGCCDDDDDDDDDDGGGYGDDGGGVGGFSKEMAPSRGDKRRPANPETMRHLDQPGRKQEATSDKRRNFPAPAGIIGYDTNNRIRKRRREIRLVTVEKNPGPPSKKTTI